MDRTEVEVQQCMELTVTNRPTAFFERFSQGMRDEGCICSMFGFLCAIPEARLVMVFREK